MLKMVLGYYGIDRTESELGMLCGGSKESGISGEMIINVARNFGFRTELKDLASISEIKDYLRLGIPVIVDWFYDDDGHYSVVVNVDEENIYLQDPSLGHLKAMRLKVFERVWFDFLGSRMETKEDLILRRLIVIAPNQGSS